jgi:hypothetical protein
VLLGLSGVGGIFNEEVSISIRQPTSFRIPQQVKECIFFLSYQSWSSSPQSRCLVKECDLRYFINLENILSTNNVHSYDASEYCISYRLMGEHMLKIRSSQSYSFEGSHFRLIEYDSWMISWTLTVSSMYLSHIDRFIRPKWRDYELFLPIYLNFVDNVTAAEQKLWLLA